MKTLIDDSVGTSDKILRKPLTVRIILLMKTTQSIIISIIKRSIIFLKICCWYPNSYYCQYPLLLSVTE